MANTHGTLSALFTAIADAIRAKTGGTGTIVADDFPDAISEISTGVDTSDATASSGDILSGKTAYVNGSKVTGTIASKTASNLSASGATVTVPAGYYASKATKSVATAIRATPSVSVSDSGLITASATQTAGYVYAGTKSATKQLTTQAAKTVTPGASAQTAVASGRYTTGAVTVAGDANLVAANIVSGVSIFGVTGTHECSGAEVLYYTGGRKESMSVQIPNGFSGTTGAFYVSGVFSLEDSYWDTEALFYVAENEVIKSFDYEIADYTGKMVTVSVTSSHITVTFPANVRNMNYCGLTIVREV